jgi:inner membrane protein
LPTIITHAIVGGAAFGALEPGNRAPNLWIPAIVCSVLPDADVIGFSYGIPYASFFGHRGFFHCAAADLQHPGIMSADPATLQLIEHYPIGSPGATLKPGQGS